MKRLSYHIILVLIFTIAVTMFDRADAIVSDGERANATNFNASFMSREVDTDTIGNLTVKQNSELRLEDVADGEYISLKTPATLTQTLNFILPGADGNPTDIIETDGSGNLSFVTKPTSFDYVAASDDLVVVSDTVSGNQLKDSPVSISATGNTSGVNEFSLNSFFDMGELTTPSNPATSRYRLYFKNTGSLYFLDEFGTENEFRYGLVDLTSQVTGILPVANGGTNSSTALANDLVMISTAGSIVESSTTSTELSYLNNVTSDIQAQIDGKEPTLTKGDLTESTSSVLTITGGTGAVIGTGASIEVQQATTSTAGYLSSADWNTFSGKQDTVSGTANEIDFTANVIGLADDPILPGSGATTLPIGNTAARPGSPVEGMLRYNSELSTFEGYDGAWGPIAGGGGGGGVDEWAVSTSYAVDDLVWEGTLIYKALSAHTSDATAFATDYAAGRWVEMVNSLDLLGKGSLVTSNGTDNGEFTACADGETLMYDASETNGFKCVAFNVATSRKFGSVKWDTTTNCGWGNGAGGTWTSYVVDTDCDNNARTIVGQYNTTNGDVGNADGQKPQIKFSQMPAGTYQFVGKGFFYQNTGECAYRFTDGTNSTTANSLFENGNDTSTPVIMGEITYDSSQGATTIEVQSYELASVSCDIQVTPAPREFEISVYYYPPAQNAVPLSCEGLECENTFSAKISSSAVVTDENVDWIDSASYSTGLFTVNLQSGLFDTAPNCQITPGSGYTGNVFGMITSQSATTLTISMDSDGGSASAYGFNLSCEKAGSDHNSFDKRFVPVVDDTDIYVYGTGNGSTSITADVTPLDFTEVSDASDSWDGSTFTVPSTGKYEIQGMANFNAVDTYFKLFRSTDGGSSYSHYKAASNFSGTGTIAEFDVTAELNAGDKIQIRSNAGITLSNSSVFHYINIRRLKEELKAFIGNLTPTEFVQTPGSNMPVLVSALVTSMTTVSEEDDDFLNGNCSTVGTGDSTCTFTSSYWSATPHCWVQTTGGILATRVARNGTTDVNIDFQNTASAATDDTFILFCKGKKQ